MTNDLRDETQLAIKSDCELHCEVFPSDKFSNFSFSEAIFKTGDHKFVSKSVAQFLCVLNKVRTNLVKRCGDSNHGNRLITNGEKNIKIIKNIEIKTNRGHILNSPHIKIAKS